MLELKRRFKLSKNSHRHLKSRDLSGREDEEHKAIFATIHDKLAAATTFLSVLTWKKTREFSDRRMGALWSMEFWIRGFSKLKNKDRAVVCLLFESWRAFPKSSALSFFPPGVANPEK